MDDKEFNTLADATLARIDAALETSGADVDCQLAAGGVLEVADVGEANARYPGGANARQVDRKGGVEDGEHLDGRRQAIDQRTKEIGFDADNDESSQVGRALDDGVERRGHERRLVRQHAAHDLVDDREAAAEVVVERADRIGTARLPRRVDEQTRC